MTPDANRALAGATGSELMACPFCGSANVGLPFVDRPSHWVKCFDCECDGPLIQIGTPDPQAEAIKVWNRRASNVTGERPGENLK